MVDRFNNASAPPNHSPFDDPGFANYQGGKFYGRSGTTAVYQTTRAQQIWLSPVLRNLQFDPSYHG